jgi:catechol 2,3-dioxygenase-like lactoylglutathione lyase family enzyme
MRRLYAANWLPVNRGAGLLQRLSPDTPVASFLAKRGPGLHHVAYRVGDVEEALAALKASGALSIDERPRTGIRGARVAFLHPASTRAVLTEIVHRTGSRVPDEKPPRISTGFIGGQVLAARVAPAELTRIRQALPAAGWHDLTAEDGTVMLDLSQVVYALVDHDEHRVGFGT